MIGVGRTHYSRQTATIVLGRACYDSQIGLGRARYDRPLVKYNATIGIGRAAYNRQMLNLAYATIMAVLFNYMDDYYRSVPINHQHTVIYINTRIYYGNYPVVN